MPLSQVILLNLVNFELDLFPFEADVNPAACKQKLKTANNRFDSIANRLSKLSKIQPVRLGSLHLVTEAEPECNVTKMSVNNLSLLKFLTKEQMLLKIMKNCRSGGKAF